MNCRGSFVEVEIRNDEELLAEAIGGCILDVAFGKIFVSKGLLRVLSDGELRFVLAHEAVHIRRNHTITSLLIKLPETILKSVRKVLRILLPGWIGIFLDFLPIITDVAKFLYFVITRSLPPGAALTREQELEADIEAIILNDFDISSAVSCLKKLVNYDLDKPSHLWEVLGVKLPVMTMRERISEIIRRFNVIKNLRRPSISKRRIWNLYLRANAPMVSTTHHRFVTKSILNGNIEEIETGIVA